MAFPRQDIDTVRDLARQVAEVAALPVQTEKASRWRRHNALRRGRPMVLIFPEGSWRELQPDSVLACTDPLCRGYEADLRRRLYYWHHLRDDNVIDADPLVMLPRNYDRFIGLLEQLLSLIHI